MLTFGPRDVTGREQDRTHNKAKNSIRYFCPVIRGWSLANLARLQRIIFVYGHRINIYYEFVGGRKRHTLFARDLGLLFDWRSDELI